MPGKVRITLVWHETRNYLPAEEGTNGYLN